jgi:hypothetical protein
MPSDVSEFFKILIKGAITPSASIVWQTALLNQKDAYKKNNEKLHAPRRW